MTGTGHPFLREYVASLRPVEAAWANMKNNLGNPGSCSTAWLRVA